MVWTKTICGVQHLDSIHYQTQITVTDYSPYGSGEGMATACMFSNRTFKTIKEAVYRGADCVEQAKAKAESWNVA